MKKKSFKNLSLNKKSISKFDQSKEVIGGMKSVPMNRCQYFPTFRDCLPTFECA